MTAKKTESRTVANDDPAMWERFTDSVQLPAQGVNLEALIDSQYMYMEGYLVTSPSGREACIEARKVAEANGVKTALTLSDQATNRPTLTECRQVVGDTPLLTFRRQK